MSFEDLISLAGYGIEAVGVLVIIGAGIAGALLLAALRDEPAVAAAPPSSERQPGVLLCPGVRP